jgi:hypothetical protein
MHYLKRIAGAAALGATLLFGYVPFSSPAQAGYVVTLKEVGSDVVATGSGVIDLNGLTGPVPSSTSTAINPAAGSIFTGPTSDSPVDIYFEVAGPASFGSGGLTLADNGNGNTVGIIGSSFSVLLVPGGYASGAPLSDTSTYTGQTFSSLEVILGTYEWTWGSGPDQNFTLIIGAAAVPEPASGALLGTALAWLLLASAIRRI